MGQRSRRRWRGILLLGGLGWGSGAIAAPASGPAARFHSMGDQGIQALQLQAAPYDLRGRKVGIGQVEIGRPARPGFDKTGTPAVVPTLTFHMDRPSRPDDTLDGHAQSVAGVAIGRSKDAPGVAPEAKLYAASTGYGSGGNGQSRECLASQQVALQNGGDVRAINFSFGEPLARDPRIDARLDGRALLTLCIDWSARAHDVLYIIAGNQGGGGISIPTDTFNGVNVAFTRRFRGAFSQVDFANLGNVLAGVGARLVGRESNVGGRRSVDLVAPGSDVALLGLDGSVSYASGTSFAAPHVLGTVALIQEYGDRQVAAGAPHWTLDSRRHQTLKAVLMNAAEKVRDRGDGLRLGMGRDVWTEDVKTWIEGDAYGDRTIPLDAQLGTGQLNALRAYRQFAPGQHGSDRPVPPIGWDFSRLGLGEGGDGAMGGDRDENAAGSRLVMPLARPVPPRGPQRELGAQGDAIAPSVAVVEMAPRVRDYVFSNPLKGDSYVAATLAWSRQVELLDQNGDGQYNLGEQFRDRGLSDLDLYLMPMDDPRAPLHVCSSVSAVDSVEHIFCPVPKTGRYKLRVVLRRLAQGDRPRGSMNPEVTQAMTEGINEDYALAWWTVPAP
jgi:subtilisin family serine protease